jgi:hypothetical protein
MGDRSEIPPERVPVTRTWTADAGSAGSMARAALGVAQRKREAWLTHASVAVGFGLLGALTTVRGLVAGVIAATLIAVFVWTDYRRLLKGVRLMFPAGEELGIGVGPTGMTVRTSDGTSHCNFSMFRRFELLSRHVLLENRVRGIVHLYPRELFSDEDLEHIRASVPS